VPEPQLSQVYKSPINGLPLIYVRTEQRPGCPEPEHLFVCTRNRAVFSLWTRSVPEDFELIIDTDGRKQAEQQEWLTVVAEHEKGVLVDLLKKACEWLPSERAKELRQEWVRRQPPQHDE
jgi:hypothetical protein